MLPIGISFYTFQAVSYVTDVYRRSIRATRSIADVALYLAFFPQVLAGPIERAGHLMPQLSQLRSLTGTNLYMGSKLILWGLACKLLVADKLALPVERVFLTHEVRVAGELWAALFGYSLRIYFDFLGYTTIAIGIGRLFGVQLSRNFDRPYLAPSLKEFWRRWHITLMAWLRDYVYIPLRHISSSGLGFVTTILAVFGISGLWHGAATSFVVWGLLHGCLYLAERGAYRAAKTIGIPATLVPRWVRVGITFGLVTAAWLPFAVNDMSVVSDIAPRLFHLPGILTLFAAPIEFSVAAVLFALVIIAAIGLDSTKVMERVTHEIPRTPFQIASEIAVVNVTFALLLLFGDIGPREFIYFRF